MVAGSKTTMSAYIPSLIRPRPSSPRLPAGSPVILRTASCSDITLSSRTYLPSKGAKLPYARGCVDSPRKTPSAAIEAPSELIATHRRLSSFGRFSSLMLKKTAPTRERSSSTRSRSASTSSTPRSFATSESILPISARSLCERKLTSSVGDIGPCARISRAMRARSERSCTRLKSASLPPLCAQDGICELRRRRLDVLESEHVRANGGRADERRDIGRDAAFLEPGKVLAERGPFNGVGNVVLRRKRALLHRRVERPHRRAFAKDFQCHSLPDLALRPAVRDQRFVRPRKHVDEAGRDRTALGVDHDAGVLGVELAENDDAIAANADVDHVRGISRPVVDHAVVDENVEHRQVTSACS